MVGSSERHRDSMGIFGFFRHGIWEMWPVDQVGFGGKDTLPETNSSHLKLGHPKRKLVFQPSIFRCELLVSGRVIFVTWRCDFCIWILSSCFNL